MPNCIPLLQNYINGSDSAYCEMSLSGMIVYIIILFFFVWVIKDIIGSYRDPLKHFGEQRVRKIIHKQILLTVLFGITLFFSSLFNKIVAVKSDGLLFYKILPYSFLAFIAMYIYVYYIGTKKYLSDKGVFDRN
jgi:hypothetical protein